jgi:hypothetical protein
VWLRGLFGVFSWLGFIVLARWGGASLASRAGRCNRKTRLHTCRAGLWRVRLGSTITGLGFTLVGLGSASIGMYLSLASLGSALPGLGSTFVGLPLGESRQNRGAQQQSSCTAPVRKYRASAFKHIFIGRQPWSTRGGGLRRRSPIAINLTRGWASIRINHPPGFQN